MKPKGPGTILKGMIPKLFKRGGCTCTDFARKMDSWGVAGCEQNRERIIRHLLNQAQRSKLLSIFGERPARIVAEYWVNEAIKQASSYSGIDNDQWFVLITSAPRKEPTLAECIASVRAAGWEPRIFAEPGTEAKDVYVHQNINQLGVWHNWLNSCRVALQSNAQYIVTLQDDITLHPETREYVEKALWPDPKCGFLSLYTPKHYSLKRKPKNKYKPPGINKIVTNSLWGACALVFDRRVLAQVVYSQRAKTWLGAAPRSGNRGVYQSRRSNPHTIANSDTAIGRIINDLKRTMWFIDPSPAEHIARYSSISHGDNTGRRNCIRCANHEMPLEEQAPIPETYTLKI